MQTIKAKNEEKEIDTHLQTRNTSLTKTGNFLDLRKTNKEHLTE